MKFYEIISGDSHSKIYAWASGYGPMREAPFLSQDFFERRKKFWEVNPSPPGLQIDSGSRKWPDFMGCGHPPPSYFVSQRVIDALQRAGIEVLSLTHMPIAENLSKKLADIPPPAYYVVRGKPGIEWNFKACGVPTHLDGQPITNPYPKNWPPRIVFNAKSWSGLDLFTYSNFQKGQNTMLFCSERVVELAQAQCWTNVLFNPVATI